MDENIQAFDSLEIRVFDKDGNPKPVFQENKLFLYLIKIGLTPRFPKIPYLLGTWSDHKEIINGNN